MKCPNCNVNLVMSDRNGVEIDYCPECRGVWLDRGELDKIIDRSTNITPPARTTPPPRYDAPKEQQYNQNQDEYAYKKKRKDSFLGDLFDF